MERTYKSMESNEREQLYEGQRLAFHSYGDLKRAALVLSSKGYGVAVLGFSDLSEHILTVTALPDKGEA